MAFSTQRAVSDGTLTDVALEIQYIDREDINVFVADALQVVDVDYEWITDTLIRFFAPVANGLEVLLQRSTALDKVLNIFTAGASFDDPTMDENFRQMLYIAQEAREGSTLEEIFTNLNMHGYRIQNLGAGTEPGDAINYQQYVDDSLGAGNARIAAEAARDAAVLARDAAQGHAASASTSATNASNSATAASGSASSASTSATNAANAASAASTSESNAATSATNASNSATAAASSASAANSALLPVGGLLQYPTRVAIPAGFGAGDGILVSRATYPDLWALVQNGTFPSVSDATWLADPLERGKYSTGDGSTTFRLPDYNGVQSGSIGGLFFRGSSSGAGSVLRDQMQGHLHSPPPGTAGYVTALSSTFGLPAGAAVGYGQATTGNPTSDGVNGTPRVGSETRPMQVSGVWLIKMYGAPVNPGTVDVVQLAADVVALTGRVQTLETLAAKSRLIASISGGVVTVRSSYGPTITLTRNSIGSYTVSFPAQADLYYPIKVVAHGTAGQNNLDVNTYNKTLTSLTLAVYAFSGSSLDPDQIMIELG